MNFDTEILSNSVVSKRYILTSTLSAYFMFFVLSILFISSNGLYSQENGKILFLHLKISSAKTELQNYSIRPGTLKQKRLSNTTDKNFYYKAESKTGTLLYSEQIENPLIQKLEYEDEQNPGQIKQKIIKSDSAFFILRLPYNENLYGITFYSRDLAVNAKGEKKATLKTYNRIVIDLKKKAEDNDK